MADIKIFKFNIYMLGSLSPPADRLLLFIHNILSAPHRFIWAISKNVRIKIFAVRQAFFLPFLRLCGE